MAAAVAPADATAPGAEAAVPAARGRRPRRKMTPAERKAQREKRRAHWRAPRLRDAPTGWCLTHGNGIMTVINVFFMIVGCGIVGMGIWTTQSVWADIFGTGPGFTVIAFGACMILTAVTGYMGTKYDSKCLLLIYFIILFFSFVAFVVMGSMTVFDQASVNDKFSGYWDEFASEAEKGQTEFNCCGYESPEDRPRGGCEAEATADTPGCKTIGLDYVNERFVPFFFVSFITGCSLFVALWVSGFLLCRSTNRVPMSSGLHTDNRDELKEINVYVKVDADLELAPVDLGAAHGGDAGAAAGAAEDKPAEA